MVIEVNKDIDRYPYIFCVLVQFSTGKQRIYTTQHFLSFFCSF